MSEAGEIGQNKGPARGRPLFMHGFFLATRIGNQRLAIAALVRVLTTLRGLFAAGRSTVAALVFASLMGVLTALDLGFVGGLVLGSLVCHSDCFSSAGKRSSCAFANAGFRIRTGPVAPGCSCEKVLLRREI